jgi:hypothetical protein
MVKRCPSLDLVPHVLMSSRLKREGTALSALVQVKIQGWERSPFLGEEKQILL